MSRTQISLCGRCSFAAASTAFAVLFASAVIASAETACVHCTGPDVTYLCEATSDDPVSVRSAGLYCAAKLAAQNNHRSCAAQRDADGCNGVPVSIVYEEQERSTILPKDEEQAQPATDTGEPKTLGEFAEDTANVSASAVKKAGKTIGEAAGQAGQATKNALEGAGKAIGNATKKTWECLGSALNDC